MASIYLDEAEQSQVDTGELILLGLCFYSPKDDSLTYQTVVGLNLEEMQAILAKFTKGKCIVRAFDRSNPLDKKGAL